MILKPIGHIENDYQEKFGVPRQPGLVMSEISRIVLEPDYRNPDAFRGLEDFSHIWLLWEFSEGFASQGEQKGAAPEADAEKSWSPTVRPPRLGGNRRVGVFATRSPNRPNPIGLSSVRLVRVEQNRSLGPVLYVSGADLMDGTPIFDIKPFLPDSDNHPDAAMGFTSQRGDYRLHVVVAEGLLSALPAEKRQALIETLEEDPRPGYQEDPDRVYGFIFGGKNVSFRVEGRTLTILDIR